MRNAKRVVIGWPARLGCARLIGGALGVVVASVVAGGVAAGVAAGGMSPVASGSVSAPGVPPVGAAMPQFLAIGGGLTDGNELIWRRLMARAASERGVDGPKIVIVPFASAEAEEAAKRTIERMKTRVPNGRYVVLPDPTTNQERRELAEAWISRADLVFFTGGDQSRITAKLMNPEQPNRVVSNLADGMVRSGTPVAGTSAGTAVLSEVMFTGGNSELALMSEGDDPPAAGNAADPDDAENAAGKGGQRAAPRIGPRLAPGLGLVRGPIMDSHFLARGRVGRMVAALEKTGRRWGIGVADDRAVTIAGGRVTGVGDAAALLVDANDLRRDAATGAISGVRLTLLSHDDSLWLDESNAGEPERAWGPRGERVTVFPAAGALDAQQPAGQAGGAAGELAAWGKDSVLIMLRRLAAEPASVQTARSERFEVTIRADEQTRFSVGKEGDASARARALGVHRAMMEIRRRGDQPVPARTPTVPASSPRPAPAGSK